MSVAILSRPVSGVYQLPNGRWKAMPWIAGQARYLGIFATRPEATRIVADARLAAGRGFQLTPIMLRNRVGPYVVMPLSPSRRREAEPTLRPPAPCPLIALIADNRILLQSRGALEWAANPSLANAAGGFSIVHGRGAYGDVLARDRKHLDRLIACASLAGLDVGIGEVTS